MALSKDEIKFAADRLDSKLKSLEGKNLKGTRERTERNALRIAVQALRASAAGQNPMEDNYNATQRGPA